jgi:predicted alpha/beta hydrolase
VSPKQLGNYAKLTGGTLALAHARAGDPIAISSYIGSSTTFATSMENFAMTYADLMQSDYEEFTEAIASGEVQSSTEEEATGQLSQPKA